MKAPLNLLVPVCAVTLAAATFAVVVRVRAPATSRLLPRASPAPQGALERSREGTRRAVVSDRAEGGIELAPIIIVVPPPASNSP